MKEKYNFYEYLDKIRQALQAREYLNIFEKNGDTEVSIQEGFGVIQLRTEVSNQAALETTFLATVLVIGSQSGLVYQFKLVSLLPELLKDGSND